MSDSTEIWNLGTRGSNQLQHHRYLGFESVPHSSGMQLGEGQRPEDFVFSQDSVRIGGYLFRRFAVTPVLLHRPATPDTHEKMIFVYVLSGKLRLTQAGRTVELVAGESAIAIGWQPYLAEVVESASGISVAVDRDVLDSGGISFPHAVRKVVAPALLPSGMAGFFLGLFEARLYPLGLEQVTRLCRVFDSFLVELHLGYVEAARTPEERLEDQRQAILEYAHTQRGTASFSVANIAEHYGMSTRSLQRLFQSAPRSLRDELRDIAGREIS